MNATESEIERLSHELNALNWKGASKKAEAVAEQLASLLGERNPANVAKHVHSWILISEARGEIEEAIRLEDLEIARKLADVEAGDFDAYPSLLKEAVEYVQDGLHLQALRHLKLGKKQMAIKCLRDIYALGDRFGLSPDDDVQSMLADLTT
jgi:hypothetical protein